MAGEDGELPDDPRAEVCQLVVLMRREIESHIFIHNRLSFLRRLQILYGIHFNTLRTKCLS